MSSYSLTQFFYFFYRVTDADLKALVSDKVCDVEPIWKLGGLGVNSN